MPYIVYSDHGINKTFQLSEDKMTVFGREEHADFQILKDSHVSREHFAVEKDENGKFILVELGASNGTYLNDEKLESNSIVELKDGDVIRAGRQRFTYRMKPPPKTSTTTIVNNVVEEMENGKGYHTIMCEILGKDAYKPKPKG
jgi:pSer/pThr/pTyr-binding forkhead associated (FHA) protein